MKSLQVIDFLIFAKIIIVMVKNIELSEYRTVFHTRINSFLKTR